MKTIFALLLLLSNLCFAQITIKFRDDKSLTIKGEKIGTYKEYDFFDPSIEEKLTEYYCLKEQDNITIYEYRTWLTAANKGRMDELRIYTFNKNQLEKSPEFTEETDEDVPTISYSLRLSAKEEQLIPCAIYDIYKSTPNKTQQLDYIRFSALEKTQFEQLANELALPVEEEVEEEEEESGE